LTDAAARWPIAPIRLGGLFVERSSWVNAAGVTAVVSAGAVTLWLIGASMLRGMRERFQRLRARPEDDA
jgi:predicted phage tail protein